MNKPSRFTSMACNKRAVVVFIMAALALGALAPAQTPPGTVSVTVVDPSGAIVNHAKVVLRNPSLHYEKSAISGDDGSFLFSDVPPGNYSMTANASGFEETTESLAVQPGATVSLNIAMKLAGAQALVEVAAGTALIAPDAIAAYTQIAAARIEKRAGVGGSHALQELIAATPGFATEDDGLLHVRGVDDGVLYVVDGIPVMDRIDALTGTAPDLNAIRSINVMTGAIPAEFGGRSGAVVVMEGKSGLESDWTGTITAGAGSFGAAEVSTAAGGNLGKRLGVFAAGSFSQSDRFLDPPGLDAFHDHGGAGKLGIRLDWKAGERDEFAIRVSGADVGLQVPNTLFQQSAGQRQRQQFLSGEESLAWNRSWSANAQSTLAGYRQSYTAQLAGSPQDTPLFAAQDRGHVRQGVSGDLIAILHGHVIKSGAGFSAIASREFFTFAVTDTQAGSQQGFGDNVLQFDRAAPFVFSGRAVFRQSSAFIQDSFTPVSNLSVNAGLRFDSSSMLASDRQWSPRIGASYYIPRTETAVRASFDRLFMPPQVENLLLSASEKARHLSPFAGTNSPAGALVRAERTSAYDFGVSQAFRKLFRLDVDYWSRRFRNFDDPNVLFSTQVIFPNSVAGGFARGVDVRLEAPSHRGWSGYVSYSNSRILETGPINGGLFLSDNALSIGPGTNFVPDHDQRNVGDLGITYNHPRHGIWTTLAARYESGVPIDMDPDQLDSIRLRPGANLVNFERGRVRPRQLFGISAGMTLVETRHTQVQAQLDVQNLINTPFVYNFANPFSGTHFGAPRQFSGRLRFTFR
jgi:hypothetical protein